MGKSSQLWLVSLALLLAFVCGFLLGGERGVAKPAWGVEQSPSLEDFRLMLRDEMRELALADAQGGRGSPISGTQVRASEPSAKSGRTPSWEALIQRLDAAAERLEQAAARAEEGSKPTIADQVALARAGTYPQNAFAIKQYCRRLEAAEEEDEWERISAELKFQTPTQVLQRFGEPSEINLDVGTMYWEYRVSVEISPDEDYYWELDITFTDGAVMEFESDYFEGD